jgi:hypothetical protein
MADYIYQTGKFGSKDSLASGDPLKIVKGSDFEAEFPAISTAVNSKLNAASPAFVGTMTGVDINITGTLTANIIDGGTYSG